MAFNTQDRCLAVSSNHQLFEFGFAGFYVREFSYVMHFKVSGVDSAKLANLGIESVKQLRASELEWCGIRQMVDACRHRRIQSKMLQFENFRGSGCITYLVFKDELTLLLKFADYRSHTRLVFICECFEQTVMRQINQTRQFAFHIAGEAVVIRKPS
jgi:hypothetical protein